MAIERFGRISLHRKMVTVGILFVAALLVWSLIVGEGIVIAFFLSFLMLAGLALVVGVFFERGRQLERGKQLRDPYRDKTGESSRGGET